MKIFLGNIDPALRAEEIESYLRKYGSLSELRLVSNRDFGFAYFDDRTAGEEVLRTREHSVDGKSFVVELGKDQDDSRRQRRGADYVDYSLPNGRRGRRCDHCDRCPVHGVSARAKSEESPRLVIEGLSRNVGESDVRDFLSSHGFEPCWCRVVGDYALVDFRTFDERDDALKRLDGQVLSVRCGDGPEQEEKCTVQTRSFITGDRFRRDGGRKRFRGESGDFNRNSYGDSQARDVYNDSDDRQRRATSFEE